MCRLSRNSGASTSWNPKGPPRPVVGKALYPSREDYAWWSLGTVTSNSLDTESFFSEKDQPRPEANHSAVAGAKLRMIATVPLNSLAFHNLHKLNFTSYETVILFSVRKLRATQTVADCWNCTIKLQARCMLLEQTWRWHTRILIYFCKGGESYGETVRVILQDTLQHTASAV
jgi:hypothetical protein